MKIAVPVKVVVRGKITLGPPPKKLDELDDEPTERVEPPKDTDGNAQHSSQERSA